MSSETLNLNMRKILTNGTYLVCEEIEEDLWSIDAYVNGYRVDDLRFLVVGNRVQAKAYLALRAHELTISKEFYEWPK